jgi:two-component system sensor histidine kinase/response regulator
MPKLGDPRLTRTLPLAMFERLRMLLRQMLSTLGEGALLLTEDVLVRETTLVAALSQQFTIVVSKQFSIVLSGEPQELEPCLEDDTKARLYQVNLIFAPEEIATFLKGLSESVNNQTDLLHLLEHAQTLVQPNDPAIQSDFTLSLLELFATDETNSSVPSSIGVCQSFVDGALRQQVEQERLLNQVITQIRQSLELPVILETAVEQVRNFLQVDRLLIYQFDEFNRTSATVPEDDTPQANSLNGYSVLPPPQSSYLGSTVHWGCVTYEARASDTISSVLKVMERENTPSQLMSCRDKYRQGLTVAIDDIEAIYPPSSCILELLRQSQVRATLMTPIIVQDKLWGLLIAHQCFEPRQWQESEKTFLKQIAEHLAVAIYQAQLYAQLQQQKTTLEQRVIERTQELRDILQAAQSANLAKSEFLATMSHELRPPLTCVIGMSATLLRWSFNQDGRGRVPIQKQRRYLKTIQESGEHLLELINDILDLSQVEAGKAVLNVNEFSLGKLTTQTFRAFQEKADLRQVKLEMDLRVKPQVDRFCADQRRVKQILFNLLGNAIKFTPAGGEVTLRVWREQNLAIFQIEDTGIGIAEEQIPLLFQKFQQLETVYQRNYEGTGLGLALTKQLIELHGGRIEVESTIGEGSLFTVWLPTQPINSAISKVSNSQGNSFNFSQGSLVLVEDREESATLICEILTAAGYHVVWLIDGSTALTQIELLQPKAVLVNWQLRGMDGYDLIYSLRHTPSTQHIKVLALTMSTLTNEQKDELNTVVDDSLPQPIEPTKLLKEVTRIMTN